jgi:molybdate transport system substrate-binding protein
VARGFRWAAVLAVSLTLSAPAAAETFTVFAAASLREALDEGVALYRARSSDTVLVSYAASSALARQIEAGAPADLFVSADVDWMNYLERRSLINAATRRNLLGNRLVLIAAADSKLSADPVPGFPLGRLLGSGRLAMANPDAVPAGKYGKASLEALGVWQDVRPRLASAENVRAALVLVARGDAPLGIVYRTDADADPRVRVVATFAESTHPPIVYPAALTASGRPRAGDFLKWLGGAQARAVFAKHGFQRP